MLEQEHSRSPWSEATHYDQATIYPVQKPINASLKVPGSKSYANRALVIAALAEGESHLTGLLRSDDSYWGIDALKRLGLSVSVTDDEVRIGGSGGRWPNKEARLFLGAAGTLARFLPGALAASQGDQYIIDGIEQLRRRPITPLLDALQKLGADITYLGKEKGLPLAIKGTGLSGGEVQIEGHVSSQFLSGLLIASPMAKDIVKLELVKGLVQPEYIGITIDLMRRFGAEVIHDEDYQHFQVTPGGYRGQRIELEADASTACYFLAAAALTQGTVRVTNVGYDSLQPDARFIDVLEQLGCHTEKGPHYLQVTGPTQLRGGLTIDMKPMSDQAITLAALAPFADGPITVTNVPHIRHHESDRIAVICSALRQMGVQVEEREDGFTVYPGNPHGAQLDPHDDHRQAMTYSLIGLRVPGIKILNPGCVSKTCPSYFTELRKLGVDVELQ